MFTAGSLNKADNVFTYVNVECFQSSQEVHQRPPAKATEGFAPT